MAEGTVLVVEDDDGIQEFVAEALTCEGYEVISSVDGASVSVAHDEQPGVILLDMMMPGMDGVAVSQRLRADETTAHIPVIAMSAASHDGATTRGLLADDWLSKPFALDALYSTIAHWMPPDGHDVVR